MEQPIPHLLIKEGPEAGREITIPSEGARMGRSEENDIIVSDAAMSRFQCRMYFRDGFLHIMDLGSTNESLVNDKPVSDVALRFGDEILIGESLIKVVNDGLHEKPVDTSAMAMDSSSNNLDAEPAPIIFNLENEKEASDIPYEAPNADKNSDTSLDVDLGLGRREDLEERKVKGEKSSSLPLVLVTLLTMVTVFGVGVLVLMQTESAPVTMVADNDHIEVHYEKVIAGEGNIFRYAMELTNDGNITANVHNLRQQRNVIREEQVDPEQVTRLKNQLLGSKDNLLALRDEYEGLPVGDHESYVLTIIFGKEAKTIRVANQIEPDVFRQAREQIEAFTNNEVGMINFNIPPEELRSRAAESWENAQELYAQRDVKNQNLWEATQKLKDVIFLLETIEPKPDYYESAVTLRQEWRKVLMDKVARLEFEAVRAYQVGEVSKSAELFRRILSTFPEKSNQEYKQAYNRLNQIEQELN